MASEPAENQRRLWDDLTKNTASSQTPKPWHIQHASRSQSSRTTPQWPGESIPKLQQELAVSASIRRVVQLNQQFA